MIESRQNRIGAHAILIIASVIALYPLFTILLLALQEPGKRVSGLTLPDGINLGNFRRAWTTGAFDSALLSSAIVAVSVVAVAVALSTAAGYAFAHFALPFKQTLYFVLLLGLVLPYEAIVIPIYYGFDNVGLLDTRWALILPQIGLSVSFGTFWMRTAFEALPTTLTEAARIDGATSRQTLTKVLVPLIGPAALTLASLLFLFTWNEFLLALVLVPRNQDVQTAPLALSLVAGNRRTGDPAVHAAAALIVAAPVMVAFALLQRRFIHGLTAGGVKG